MILNSKKYLTISDVENYSISETGCRIELKDLIQLEREGRLTPVVYLDVNFISRKLPDGNLYVFDKAQNKYIKRIKGYFKPKNFILLDNYERGSTDGIDSSLSNEMECIFLREGLEQFEVVEEVPKSPENIGCVGYIFNKHFRDENGFYENIEIIDIESVLIPRSELDEILDYSEDKDKQRIRQLEEELGKVRNNKPSENQGDTLLILGAVLQSIKKVAKPNYTQQNLINAIVEEFGATSGISESTLNKKFPEAKKYLNQRVNH